MYYYKLIRIVCACALCKVTIYQELTLPTTASVPVEVSSSIKVVVAVVVVCTKETRCPQELFVKVAVKLASEIITIIINKKVAVAVAVAVATVELTWWQ